ncbi:MAG TPA: hypothetical protein VNK49_12260, partial [Anaerolineales bacterium]|nr:hypothetical protein [Anaerolineales bacterium]
TQPTRAASCDLHRRQANLTHQQARRLSSQTSQPKPPRADLCLRQPSADLTSARAGNSTRHTLCLDLHTGGRDGWQADTARTPCAYVSHCRRHPITGTRRAHHGNAAQLTRFKVPSPFQRPTVCFTGGGRACD